MSDPLAFPVPTNVPILGQPCSIGSWFPTLSLTCNCETKPALLVVGFHNVTVCPACGRGFELYGVRHDARTGQPPHFDINIVLPSARGGVVPS